MEVENRKEPGNKRAAQEAELVQLYGKQPQLRLHLPGSHRTLEQFVRPMKQRLQILGQPAQPGVGRSRMFRSWIRGLQVHTFRLVDLGGHACGKLQHH